MECTAGNMESPWHNFRTDPLHWTVEFGSTAAYRDFCVNQEGFIDDAFGQNKPHMQFIKTIKNNGATKIWSNTPTGKDVHVTFTGGPDFTACV